MIEQAPLLDHGAFRDARGARRIDDVGQSRGRRPHRRGSGPGRRAGEFGESEHFRACSGRHPEERLAERRGAALPGEHKRRAAVLDDLGQPGRRDLRGQRKKSSAGSLHGNHCG